MIVTIMILPKIPTCSIYVDCRLHVAFCIRQLLSYTLCSAQAEILQTSQCSQMWVLWDVQFTKGPWHSYSETFSCTWQKLSFFFFLVLFLLASHCSKNVSTSIACSRKNKLVVSCWKGINKALISTIPKEEWHKFHVGVSVEGK